MQDGKNAVRIVSVKHGEKYIAGAPHVPLNREAKDLRVQPPAKSGHRTREGEPNLRFRQVALEEKSIDEKARTAAVSFSSETREVMTYDWDIGEVPEILSHAEGACDLSPFLNAGSFLLNHDARVAVATPREAVITDKRGRAVAYFPEGDDDSERAWTKVRTRLVRGVSVGWAPLAVEKVKAGARSSQGHEGPCVLVTRWAVHEISFTPIPADSTVGVGRGRNTVTPANAEEVGSMEPKVIRSMVRMAGLPAHIAEKIIGRKLDSLEAVEAAISEEVEKREGTVKKRKVTKVAAREDDADDDDDSRETDDDDDDDDDAEPRSAKLAARKARLAERDRCTEISGAVRAAKLGSAVEDELIEGGVTIEKAREIILKKLAEGDAGGVSTGRNGERETGKANVQLGEEQSEKHFRYLTVNLGRRAHATIARAEGMEGAGGYQEDEESKKVDRAHVTLQTFVRELLVMRGVNDARFMAPEKLWESALNPRMRFARAAASNTGADLANALSNLQNKALMRGFMIARPTWRSWCRKGNLADFKIAPTVQLSDFAQLRETGENGEILDSKLSDRAENRQLAVYARRISLTMQMFINDDLDALGRLPAMMGKSAAQLPSRLVYTHLMSNPTMSDGNALFDNTYHGNLLTGAASNLDATNKIAALAGAQMAFRKQTSPKAPNDTEFAAEPIDIEPAVMVLPPEHEYHGNTLVNPNMYIEGSNLFKNKYKIEVESRLSNANYTGYSTTAWYLAAAAEDADTMEVSFLNGNENPITSSWEEFEQLAVQFRAWLACGAKALDWRGIVKNAGA